MLTTASTPATAPSISLAQFVPPGGPHALQLAGLPRMPCARCLLAGPPRSGKTSLLFQYALSVAGAGGEVVVLAQRAGLEQAPPLLAPGQAAAAAASPAWGRVAFKYVSNLAELRGYGACLHLLERPPAAVVVDDVSGLAAASRIPDRRARDAELTKALALLADALDQLREQQGVAVQLVACDTSADEGGGQSSAFLVSRWFPLSLSVTLGPGGSHVLAVSADKRAGVSAAAARAALHFSAPAGSLQVDRVVL